MNNPLISIITVVYNANSTLEATIKSVIGQEKELFEYWIIDGGSNDGSIDIIRKYERYLAGWVSELDKGIFDAMNKGIDRATGDWLYFLGADDTLTSGILQKVSPYLNPNLAVVYGDVMFNTGHIMHSHVGINCLIQNGIHHQGAFYRRTLFDDFRYKQKFRVYADYELTIRIYLQRQSTLYIPHIISIFMLGGNSNELAYTEINTIRSIYLPNNILNKFLSLIVNIYYPYMSKRITITRKIRKFLGIKKNPPNFGG